MWDLPGPGLEPVSLALAGGFLTTAPPGKSQVSSFNPRVDIPLPQRAKIKETDNAECWFSWEPLEHPYLPGGSADWSNLFGKLSSRIHQSRHYYSRSQQFPSKEHTQEKHVYSLLKDVHQNVHGGSVHSSQQLETM